MNNHAYMYDPMDPRAHDRRWKFDPQLRRFRPKTSAERIRDDRARYVWGDHPDYYLNDQEPPRSPAIDDRLITDLQSRSGCWPSTLQCILEYLQTLQQSIQCLRQGNAATRADALVKIRLLATGDPFTVLFAAQKLNHPVTIRSSFPGVRLDEY